MPIDATLPYDDANIFARILRGELPCKRVLETEHSLAFHDIAPLSATHILAIPKGAYVSWDDFSTRASDAELADYVRVVGQVARDAGIAADGYRLISNTGMNGRQEVPHLHVHVLGGVSLGPMLAR